MKHDSRAALAVFLVASLAVASATCTPLNPNAPHPPGAFMCEGGELPCPDQITGVHCDRLTDGSLPPDAGEMRWLFRGAKVPQNQEPPTSVVSWCEGKLEVEGVPVELELFHDTDGGYIRGAGHDKMWFRTPPEEADSVERRTCVAVDLPETTSFTVTHCTSVGGARTAPDEKSLKGIVGRASRTDHRSWGVPEMPWAWCEIAIGKDKQRIDLFDSPAGGKSHKGWLRLSGERRVCFAYSD